MSMFDHPVVRDRPVSLELIERLDFTPRCEAHEHVPAVWIVSLPGICLCPHFCCNLCRARFEIVLKTWNSHPALLTCQQCLKTGWTPQLPHFEPIRGAK